MTAKLALCIEACEFSWTSHPRGFGRGLLEILPGDLETMKTKLVDRAVCETDESLWQLLPYNVLIDEQDRIFTYVRGQAGQEGRLHDKLSIGIGGHVDHAPWPATAHDLSRLLVIEAVREVEEEVALSGPFEPEFTHYIIDHTNEVGRVHLGLLSITKVHSSQIGTLEEGIVLAGAFEPISWLVQEAQFNRLENWSQEVLRHIHRLRNNGVGIEYINGVLNPYCD